MGFHQHFIELIQQCTQTVSYSVLVGGQPYGYFKPTRGIRQGDPLSLFLFILAMEGFNQLLYNAEINDTICEVQISRHSPKITSIFFTDDVLLFCKVEAQHTTNIQHLLSRFEALNGQQINQSKSAILFPKHCPPDLKHMLSLQLAITNTSFDDKYLDPIQKGTFEYIIARINAKIHSWSSKHLSRASKSIIVKPILNAIPAYSMSCFYISDAICDHVSKLCSDFWWSARPGKRGIHWLKWKQLCQSFSSGGLGFCDCRAQNLSLLANQAWRILTRPSSLLIAPSKGNTSHMAQSWK
ncbi:hypothetical protein Cni_G20264 [Canna indica]|uniref:Reverse transcriptase domain-containing protein n=1 Tax=Canna indica TaxID=4628 RepID=A0AAQ3KSX0_9LILI|nr:hypothetical protein Cni_G20264 [Canna indica]